MLVGDQIPELVNLLIRRETCLYHACQFQDLRAYLELGGIPSRQLLENSNKRFTTFQTDNIDLVNGVWDKVFVNLWDFGSSFAKGLGATPNPYGPILLYIHPRSLIDSEDIAICLRSAGGRNFNRDLESLTSIEDVDRLFTYNPNCGWPESTFIKFRRQLQEDFQNPIAGDPEVSCTYTKGYLPIEHATFIVVDPYIIGNKSLENLVIFEIEKMKLDIEIGGRICNDRKRAPLYLEIMSLIIEKVPTLEEIYANPEVSQELKEWVDRLRGNDLEYQYQRFATYLRNGTILPILG